MAADICMGLTEEERQKLERIEYIGVICVSVVLTESISPYYVTNITDSWVPFTGIIEMSSLVDKRYFDGNALIYLPKYIRPSDPLMDAPDEIIKESFVSSLKKMYPNLTESNIKYVKIARAKRVFALSTLQYSNHLPNIRTAIPGVYILNSAHITNGTLNVNETIRVAETKLEEILAQIRHSTA